VFLANTLAYSKFSKIEYRFLSAVACHNFLSAVARHNFLSAVARHNFLTAFAPAVEAPEDPFCDFFYALS